MRIVIVGCKNGRRTIRWSPLIALSLLLPGLMILCSGLLFRAVAGSRGHMSMLFSGVMGLGIVGMGLMNGLKTPADKLHSID